MRALLLSAALGLLLVLPFSAAAVGSDEIELTGKMACAKCTLAEEGRDQCQNVLIVEPDGEAAEAVYYYVAKNEVAEAFGEVCQQMVEVTVVGTVFEEEGQTWIDPVEIRSQDPDRDASAG